MSQGNVGYYEDEVAQLSASLKVAELETKVMVDGVATREWGLDYWLGQMKSMMHTTPAATLKLWEYAMVYVEATTAVKRSKDWSPPTSRHLAELRTDAGLVGQICAGVMVAKAKSVLTVFIDETELECSSMQSMITTIVDESDCVRSIALDGVTLLKKKTSQAALLLIRRWTRHKRPLVRKHLAELAKAQVERKLQMRRACVEAKIEKYREVYARAMVEWNVKVSGM